MSEASMPTKGTLQTIYGPKKARRWGGQYKYPVSMSTGIKLSRSSRWTIGDCGDNVSCWSYQNIYRILSSGQLLNITTLQDMETLRRSLHLKKRVTRRKRSLYKRSRPQETPVQRCGHTVNSTSRHDRKEKHVVSSIWTMKGRKKSCTYLYHNYNYCDCLFLGMNKNENYLEEE